MAACAGSDSCHGCVRHSYYYLRCYAWSQADALAPEAVEQLQRYLPTSEERELLSGYVEAGGDPEGLGKAEQFFLAITKIPRLQATAQSVILRFDALCESFWLACGFLPVFGNETHRSIGCVVPFTQGEAECLGVSHGLWALSGVGQQGASLRLIGFFRTQNETLKDLQLCE
eukprot:scaffold455339_cov50-Prasinocladus_malaysianus.AAC.2